MMRESSAKRKRTVPVSVIIPCYCCADTITRAVDSVMRQTTLPKELLLIDDASLDRGGTLSRLHELKQKYCDQIYVEVISLHSNGGPSEARNKGWSAATEPYLAFLDADDSWVPQKLELQYSWMKSRPEVALSGHLCVWDGISEMYEHELFDGCGTMKYAMITKTSMLMRNAFSTPSAMLKRDIPLRFHEGKRYAEDYLLWLQIVCGGYAVARLDVHLAVLYKPPFGESGLSSDLWKMECGELDNFRRLYKARSIGKSMYFVVRVFSLIKYLRRVVVVTCRRVIS